MQINSGDLTSEIQVGLRDALRALKPAEFERLAAALIGEMLDLPIFVASSGFQHGGDAGPAGRNSRAFRIETKRYGDTNLKSRELLGEIDHALMRDPALEAWILVATREASEQLAADLQWKMKEAGVPVLIIDWAQEGLPDLAALCSVSPEICARYLGDKWVHKIRAIAPALSETLLRIRREFQSWSLGFEGLRSLTHDNLRQIWTGPGRSRARFGQDVAGGDRSSTIVRKASADALQSWWDKEDSLLGPAILTGLEGYGKTWAAIGWLQANLDDLPILFTLPSSRFVNMVGSSQSEILGLLAAECAELSCKGDAGFWRNRLARLFKRPEEEGPVACLLMDGLNQDISIPWTRIFQVLQDEPFAGRLRAIATTRSHHFSERLRNLSGLLAPCTKVDVDRFSEEPGGELDQMLAHDNLTRDDLPDDLIAFARTPRLYAITIKLRQQLGGETPVTVHRLLWEYGRDTWSTGADRAFSEKDWKSVLKEIAEDFRNGLKELDDTALADRASRPDFDSEQVYNRLSELIDGQFLTVLPSGKYKLAEETTAFALGAALLARLTQSSGENLEAIDLILNRWLDPISGFDERADILRAAITIMVSQQERMDAQIATALLRAWLSTQNLSANHHAELRELAPALVAPLLGQLSFSPFGGFRAGWAYSLDALRDLPKTQTHRELVRDFAVNALVQFDRGIDAQTRRIDDTEKHRSEFLTKRLGRDEDGPHRILGRDFEFEGGVSNHAIGAIPALLEGHELVHFQEVFVRTAILEALSRSGMIWDDLKWVLLQNEIDFELTASALDSASKAILERQPEVGLHPDFPARVAALLLWLSGKDALEIEASEINPSLDSWANYKEDYERDPASSLFRLERRHVDLVLARHDIPLLRRLQRVEQFWQDPSLTVDSCFVEELEDFSDAFDLSEVHAGLSTTAGDLNLGKLVVPLARFSPSALARLMRRLYSRTEPDDSGARRSLAYHVHDGIVLQDSAMADTLMHRAGAGEDEEEKSYVRERFLLAAILDLSCVDQFKTLIEADLASFSYDPGKVLHNPSPAELEELIEWARERGRKSEKDLVLLLSITEANFSESALSWLSGLAFDDAFECRNVAIKTYANAAGERLGRELLERNWAWEPGSDTWINHYGSRALIDATLTTPFERIASAITPSLLPHALRERGSQAQDVAMAVEILDALLMDASAEIDPGGRISIDTDMHPSDPAAFSIEPPPLYSGWDAGFREMANREAVNEHRRRVVETAVARIREARAKHARLYLTHFFASDFDAIVEGSPQAITRWLSGCEDRTAAFRRRVVHAEGFMLALCEALLRLRPEMGASLWRALNDCLHTRYIGSAQIEERAHMLFRVTNCEEIAVLRSELLERAESDAELFDIALAAQANGELSWLDGIIAADGASKDAWRRQRAMILQGYLENGEISGTESGVDGSADHNPEGRLMRMQSWRFRDACSRHWWNTYWSAERDEDAYAAWTLFKHTADRRAHVWMRSFFRSESRSSKNSHRRLAHMRLNLKEVERAMKDQEKNLDREFLGRRQGNDIGPWRTPIDAQAFA